MPGIMPVKQLTKDITPSLSMNKTNQKIYNIPDASNTTNYANSGKSPLQPIR